MSNIPEKLWPDKWWMKDKWRKFFPKISDDEYKSSFHLLEEIFDEDWYKLLGKQSYHHPLVKNILMRESAYDVDSMLYLAQLINTLKDTIGFGRVLEDYKVISRAYSAHQEMVLCSGLKSQYYTVDFIPPKPKKGPTPDIICSKNGKEFVVECKYINEVEKENWFDNYRLHYGRILNEVPTGDLALLFINHIGEIDITRYINEDGSLLSPYLAALINTFPIANEIYRHYYSFGKPFISEIEGVGIVGLIPTTKTFFSSVGLPENDSRHLIRRLFGNGVKKAVRQINASGLPGIAVIFQAYPPDRLYMQRKFNELVNDSPDKYDNLIGVLVLQAQNILKYIHPNWIENKNCKYSLHEFDLDDAFKQLFDI